MAKKWTAEEIEGITRSFQPACILVAGVDLDVFSRLDGSAMTASALASEIESDPRATTILLDALRSEEHTF